MDKKEVILDKNISGKQIDIKKYFGINQKGRIEAGSIDAGIVAHNHARHLLTVGRLPRQKHSQEKAKQPDGCPYLGMTIFG